LRHRLKLSYDANADGVVDVNDLLLVILNWGSCTPPLVLCPGDLTGNGVVGVEDLVAVLLGWMFAGVAERAVRKRAERSNVLDATLTIVLGKVTRALVLAVTLIAVLKSPRVEVP